MIEIPRFDKGITHEIQVFTRSHDISATFHDIFKLLEHEDLSR